MPYNSIKDLPNFLNKYSRKLKSQWRKVFNSTWKKLSKEGVTGKNREARAFRAANSVLKKRFKGKKSMEKNTREDYFSHLVDKWLSNLTG